MSNGDQAKQLELGLRGTTAVVIGSGPGIGAATVELLVAAGCKVVAADLDLGIAKNRADLHGDAVTPASVDVTDRESVRDLFAHVTSTAGAPSVVIDVVGIARPKPVAETTDDDWDVMQQLNLRQQFIVSQEAVRVLARPGAYVAVASINGVVSSPMNAAYGAAKAGVVSLVRSLALEVAAEGIRINAVAPGIVGTPRLNAFFESTGRRREFEEAVPMGRLANPTDVAGAIVWLASPLAAYVTGQVIAVDGGATVKYPLALMA